MKAYAHHLHSRKRRGPRLVHRVHNRPVEKIKRTQRRAEYVDPHSQTFQNYLRRSISPQNGRVRSREIFKEWRWERIFEKTDDALPG